MEVRTERLVVDHIEAQEGATIDLGNAAGLVLPRYPTAGLPAGAVDGTLVWDETDQMVKVAAAGLWLPLAVII
jgi:hypothetical protein